MLGGGGRADGNLQRKEKRIPSERLLCAGPELRALTTGKISVCRRTVQVNRGKPGEELQQREMLAAISEGRCASM